jgi:hypothetical protein
MANVPTGVKVISVLYYIAAVLSLLGGIAMLVGAGLIGSLANSIPLLGLFGGGLFVVGAIIMIGLAALDFFVGLGLWKGQQWARIVAIIFAALGALSALVSLVQGNIGGGGIVGLIIHGLIGGYLLLNSSVKMAFA